MENKILIYGGATLVLILLVVSIFAGFGSANKKVEPQKEINPELEKYRSEEIPEECRMPGYENNLNSWKEHLSHHKPTWYCLEDYYGENIENFMGGEK